MKWVKFNICEQSFTFDAKQVKCLHYNLDENYLEISLGNKKIKAWTSGKVYRALCDFILYHERGVFETHMDGFRNEENYDDDE